MLTTCKFKKFNKTFKITIENTFFSYKNYDCFKNIHFSKKNVIKEEKFTNMYRNGYSNELLKRFTQVNCSYYDITNFSKATIDLLAVAQQEAKNLNKYQIDSALLLLALCLVKDPEATPYIVMNGMGLSTTSVYYELADIEIENEKAYSIEEDGNVLPVYHFSYDATLIMDGAEEFRIYMGDSSLTPTHIILSMFQEIDSEAYNIMQKYSHSFDVVEELFDALIPELRYHDEQQKIEWTYYKTGVSDPKPKLPRLKSSTREMIRMFGADLTKRAEKGEIEPCIGREKEMDRVVRVLSRRSKNNPCLVGEPGVGKTAIAEGLALKIFHGEVPNFLKKKRIVNIELSRLIAGSKYRGEFEARLQNIIQACKKEKNKMILFIDEIHTLVGAGGTTDGTLDAANMLKPALGRGEMTLIGATTIDEYRKHIQRDGALERRFQAVRVPEPTPEEAIDILHGIKFNYGDFHEVVYTDESLTACVELSQQYILDKFLPDKAIDLLDETGSLVKLRPPMTDRQLKEYKRRMVFNDRLKKVLRTGDAYEIMDTIAEEIEGIEEAIDMSESMSSLSEKMIHSESLRKVVRVDDVKEVLEEMTGIKISEASEKETVKLLRLEELLHETMIGQDQAVTAVAKAIRRARAGLRDPRRPIASFIFAGPTGVGKTQLAKALSEIYFGSEQSLVRFDMGEYTEPHTISKLIGSPPGYIGHDEGGMLTEAVKKNPHTCILFDEVEKAHQKLYQSFLQLLDEGRMTDAQGRVADFTNSMIIMTTNLGAKEIDRKNSDNARNGLGKISESEAEEEIMIAIRGFFSPEFINRLDDIILFKHLTQKENLKIFDIFLRQLNGRASELGISLSVSTRCREYIVEIGFNPDMGARPLKRTISTFIEDPLSEKVLIEEIVRGDRIIADYMGGKIVFIRSRDNGEVQIIKC